MKELNERLSEFFFEAGILARFKRSGFDFLGSGDQNIAAHSFRTAIIGYVLASITDGVDPLKTAAICLFHDLPEARTGDINYFQRKYVEKNEKKATADMLSGLPIKGIVEKYLEEFNKGEGAEGIIARDADVLELIFTLKEELDKGNPGASEWISGALTRLKTKEARQIAETALKSRSEEWWRRNFKNSSK